MSGNIGMMEGAYFVSRGDILNWMNGLLGTNFTKIEQISSGACLCQILDSIYPGKVALSKVNFNAKFEWEYIKNLKVLQEAFLKLGIEKTVDIQKLCKSKYQDNLEFMQCLPLSTRRTAVESVQWFKRYWDLHYPGGEYNAEERRRAAGIVLQPTPPPDAETSGELAKRRIATSTVKRNSYESSTMPQSAEPKPKSSSGLISGPARVRVAKPVASSPQKSTVIQSLDAQLKAQAKQLADLRITAEALEKERDFYFQKLLAVESVEENAQQELKEFVAKIQTILYATEDQPAQEAPLSPVQLDAE